MKRILFTMLLSLFATLLYSQTTYYWVGGTAPTTSITIGTNWNTSLDGLGSTRPSSSGATDILVFDGTNVAGTVPATGPVTVLANGSITCGQLKFVNNAAISFVRATTGTSTMTISGGTGDDFVVEAGASFSVPVTTTGSLRFAMGAANTGRVSGTISITTTQQFRFDNTTTGLAGAFIFSSGSSFTTNITSASSSYAFGSGTQSSEKWVVFEDGAHLYYNGGYSPMGGTSTYSAIDFKPGSFWHHRANNGTGSFVNRKGFGNFIVENNATLTADGPVYRINNLTVEAGSSFITHTSGQTAVMGNIVVDGTLSSPVAAANELILAGDATQTISGTGSMNIASLIVGDRSSVVLNKSIGVDQQVIVNGKLNFGTNQLTGSAGFTAEGVISAVAGTGTTVAGSYQLTGNTTIPATARGQSISGAGIAPNTTIVSFSVTNDTIYLSNPLTASATGVTITVTTGGATLETANASGFDPATGSAAVSGNKIYKDSINYIINAATSIPFGVSTGSAATSVHAGFAAINAAVTTNLGISLNEYLSLNGKLTLRPSDTVHILSGAVINGTFNASNYIATDYNTTTGLQSIVQYDGAVSAVTLPVGTVSYYLPVTITPAGASDFAVAVFEGITTNAAVNGTPLTPVQKQTVVNAVWNINRLAGSGNADLQLGWAAALEGSTFTTLPSTDIGVIINNGSSWSLPVGTGDNTANTALAAVSSFGSFSAGAVPPTQPFVFNPIPVKTYGDADFNGGATSLNTTQPIIYSSSDPAVATIVNGDIHIVGAGIADITASQASDGFYPAASVSRTLTVNKAALIITADNKLKFEGQANPVLTASYTGFVLNETAAVLLTPAVLTTTAVLTSLPGTYPINVSGATSGNYDISFVNGVLTVQAKQNQTITFNAIPTKTYGNADFAAGGSSTNNTIPVTYTSSNTGVATIIGSAIHIVGAGTSVITASQAGNEGYFPATDVARTLTVNKVNLTVRVRDTTKVEGQVNPDFTMTYTGFVLGETAANLNPAPVVATSATTNSAAGNYAIIPEGGVSQNYNFIYVAGRLTIYPPGGNGQQYMNAFMSNSTTLNVRVFSVEPVLGDIRLYDLAGRPLLKKNFFMPSGFATTTIQVPTLPSGLYVVTITGNGVDLKKTIPIIK